MNQSQKKSVAFSGGLHLAVFLGVVFLGSAFHTRAPAPLDLPPIEFTPVIATDTGKQGGGNPKPSGHAPAAPADRHVEPAPVRAPVAPTHPPKPVVRPKPVTEPVKTALKEKFKDVVEDPDEQPPKEPAAHAAKPKLEPKPEGLEPAPKQSKKKPVIDPQITERDPAPDRAEIARQQEVRREAARKRRAAWEEQVREEDAAAQAAAQARDAAARVRRTAALGLLHDVRHAGDGLPVSGTSVHLQGPGGDGVPYGNFLLGVQHAYEQDWRPRIPAGLGDAEISAWATVTIARDGSVTDSRLTRSSGNREVDDSVNASLASVRFACPLPERAKEDHRTITIEFNVKPKRSAG